MIQPALQQDGSALWSQSPTSIIQPTPIIAPKAIRPKLLFQGRRGCRRLHGRDLRLVFFGRIEAHKVLPARGSTGMCNIRSIRLDIQKLQDYTLEKGPGITRSTKGLWRFRSPFVFWPLLKDYGKRFRPPSFGRIISKARFVCLGLSVFKAIGRAVRSASCRPVEFTDLAWNTSLKST